LRPREAGDPLVLTAFYPICPRINEDLFDLRFWAPKKIVYVPVALLISFSEMTG